MAVTVLGRVLLVALLCLTVRGVDSETYSIPNVKAEAFKPRGFRLTIPDAPNINLFAIQGFVKRSGAEDKDKFQIGGETPSKIHIGDKDFWVVDFPDLELKLNDEVDYLAFVAVNTDGYIKDNIDFKVTALKEFVALPATNKWVYPEEPETTEPPTTTTTPKPCEPTLTRVRSATTVCAGDIIFEENFDSLREDVWQVQHYIPIEHPELPFVSYQKSAVSVNNGTLHITPSRQPTESSSLYGSLDLSEGCTSGDAHQCSVVAGAGLPIPPVISGRIISKPGFAFTYGTVSIRARLPKGDWIYPEILLEPLLKKFLIGSTNTGILKVASARGNAGLPNGNKDLYGGPVLDTNCHDALLVTKKADTFWSDDFHVYSVQWTPERLVLSVDGEEYGRVEPAENGLRARLPATCAGVQAAGIAPFDEHFYLTLGLAVGGHSEFTDTNESNPSKPWRNMETKAPLKFWNNADTWQGTWQQPELVVDYVKVVAL